MDLSGALPSPRGDRGAGTGGKIITAGRRAALAAGIAGPAAFVSAWAVGSAVRKGYSPVSDTISRLAEQGASTKPLMTGGFVAYGVLMPVFAAALRGVPVAARTAIAVSGIGTLGVGAASLTPDGGHRIDTAHYVAAAVSYAANIAAPVLATRVRGGAELRRGIAVSTVIAACLGASLTGTSATGALQRAGLTGFDLWAAATAWKLLRR